MRIKKIIKTSSLFFLPFVFLIYLILCINILIKDFSYGHKSHNLIYRYSVNWGLYKIKSIKKKISNYLLGNNQKGLDTNYIYIPEKSSSSLEDNIPSSTKKYVPGFYLDQNELKKVTLRYIGDNPDNWMFEKKSLRIKLSKNRSNFLKRYFEFKMPREKNELLQFIPSILTKKLGLLAPKEELVELFVNNSTKGIFFKRERLNENFLRRNKIMPINLYKGEQTNNSENKIGLEDNLYSNAGLWEKLAYQNKFNYKNKEDLYLFINQIIEAENSKKAFNKIIENGNLENFILNEVLRIILQSQHQNNGHNLRLAIDNWSGKIYSIPFDVSYSPVSIQKDKLVIDGMYNDLFRVLNQSSVYLDKKYETLYETLENKKIINQTIEELIKIKIKYLISKKRDHGEIILSSIKNVEIENENLNVLNKGENYIDKTIQSLKRRSQNLIEILNTNPKVSWEKNDNGFYLKINGIVPVKNLLIDFKKNEPKWVVLDINHNNVIDENDKYFYPDSSGNFFIKLTLFANRIPTIIFENENKKKKLQVANTKFSFIVENNKIPYELLTYNKHTKEKIDIKIDSKNSSWPSINNIPIIENQKIKTNIFEGNIYVNKDQIINEKSKILPGTTFFIKEGVSLIFKNKLTAIGTKSSPIKFINKDKNKYWGTLAIHGSKTNGSKIKNVIIKNASGEKKKLYNLFLSIFNSLNKKYRHRKYIDEK